jgi:hypothetical protein
VIIVMTISIMTIIPLLSAEAIPNEYIFYLYHHAAIYERTMTNKISTKNRDFIYAQYNFTN